MATKKSSGGAKGQDNMGFGSGIRPAMGSGGNLPSNKKHDNEDIPWTLLVTVMAVLLMFFIVMPILAFMYYDMYFATQAAVYEVKKMRELRREILQERANEK